MDSQKFSWYNKQTAIAGAAKALLQMLIFAFILILLFPNLSLKTPPDTADMNPKTDESKALITPN